MSSLSVAQAAIVYGPIGQPIQVLASAGSGKTRVLTERVRHILENTKKDGVIALTFTNKAAEEMLNRLDDIEGLEDRCWIATIHSVAQRILDQYGATIGLPTDLLIYERDQDRKTIFLQSLRENGVDVDDFLNVSDANAKKSRERIIQKYLECFSVVKRELLNEDEIVKKYSENESFLQIYQAYQDALLKCGGIDFDDILVYAHKILLAQPWCGQVYRAKYKHICVDEAQDLNKAQYEFVKALCGDSIQSVLMVGDPNQMIYGFNGSDHGYLCRKFVEDFQPRQYELKENYRSTKAVIRLANKLKPGSQTESNYALEGKTLIEQCKDEKTEAEWICDKISALLDEKKNDEIEGEISLRNMVVIGRNRFVFQFLEERLIEKQISYCLNKGERQTESLSVFGKVLDLAIRLRLNTKDWVDGKKICATLKIAIPEKWGNEDLLKELAFATRNASISFPELQADALLAIYELDIEQPNIPKLCSVFQNRIANLSSGKTDVEIGELEITSKELLDFRKRWFDFKRKGLGDTLSAFRNAMALGQLSDEANQEGLLLSTVHTMKGLERDIVFLMGMCEGLFPDYRAQTKKEIDEERNNAFVAVTRAKRWLYITYPEERMMPWGNTRKQTPSRFVLEMKE